MAFRFLVGDRVSASFGIQGNITQYGTVVRVERGAPVVRFDGTDEDRPMRKAACYPITRDLVTMLAARNPSDLNGYQADLLTNNRMLLDGN